MLPKFGADKAKNCPLTGKKRTSLKKPVGDLSEEGRRASSLPRESEIESAGPFFGRHFLL